MKGFLLTIALIVMNLVGVRAQDWQTDFSRAKEMASKNKKPIILVFQGSDWCGPCIKLDRAVWSTADFKAYAAEHYIMVKADFPRRKSNALSPELTKANKELAEKYNKNGFFPLVVVMDGNGRVLGETSYKKLTPKEYIKELNSFID